MSRLAKARNEEIAIYKVLEGFNELSSAGKKGDVVEVQNDHVIS